MLPIDLEAVTPEHVISLISEEAEENLRLEFKAEQPGTGTDEKREMLYDIAAMANAEGGDLIYGITDRRDPENQSTGIADNIQGWRWSNPQSEITRIENLIRDSIAPRLSGVQVKHVSTEQGDVLVVRIPRSWNGPHMVTFHSVNKFYSRNSTAKFPMDVYQVGQAFAQSRYLGEQINEWRNRRVGLLLQGETPVKLQGQSVMAIHFIPASAIVGGFRASNWLMPQEHKQSIRMVGSRSIGNTRYNSSGFLMFPGWAGEGAGGYTQIFRSGILEYVNSELLSHQPDEQGNRLAPSLRIEQEIVLAFENASMILASLGVATPAFMMISLLRVRGLIMPQGGRWFMSPGAFLEDNVLTPDIQIDGMDEERPYPNLLLPLINSIWQAAGQERTPYFEGDRWNPFNMNWRF
jgi:hypothetical protein